MLRTTLTICLLFSCIAISHAADPSETQDNTLVPRAEVVETLPNGWFQKMKPSVLKRAVKRTFRTKTAEGTENRGQTLDGKRIDTKLSPAVHVNATGLENTYGSRKSSAAVDRLKSIRETPLLQIEPPRVKTGAPKVTTDTSVPGLLQDGSSRRAKRVSPSDVAAGGATAGQVTPKKAVEVAALPNDKPNRELPSVLTRRGLAEPTLAMPTAAAPAKLPLPQPRLAPSSTIKPAIVAATPSVSVPLLATPPSVAVPHAQPEPIQVTPVFDEIEPNVPREETTSLRVATTTPRVAATSPRVATLPKAPVSSRKTPTTEPAMRTESFSEVSLPPAATSQPETKALSIRTEKPAEKPAANKPSPPRSNQVRRPQAPKEQNGNVLLSNRSPVLVVRTHGPSKIRVGRTATYYVTASNKGDLAAEDVVVDVNVPNWAEITRNQSSSGAVRVEPNVNGDNVLHWSVRNLKPGSSLRLQIDLIPRASRPIELGVTWNFKSVSAMAQIEVEEPKLQLSVVGPSDIRFGDTKLYSITISNPGSGEAENVMLTLLPVNSNGGTAGERELGNIQAGTQRTIEVELTARQAGDLAIRAQVSADGGLRAEGEQPVRVRRPNLVVEATGPKKRYAGTPARYAVKVTNNGDATARDIVATVGLPMGARFVKSSRNGAFDKNRNLVQWSIGALRPGAYQIVEVTTELNSSGDSRLDARAASKLDQLTAATSAVTKVEALADLRLTVVDPVGPVPLGTEVAYEVRIENRGTKAATDINVVGYFSEGIEPVSVQGWQGVIQIGQVTLETIPQVSPGQRMVIKVMAQATRSGNHVFRAELDSDDPSTKTKLAVEEWTVFHDDSEMQLGTDDAPIWQAEKPEEPGTLSLDPVRR